MGDVPRYRVVELADPRRTGLAARSSLAVPTRALGLPTWERKDELPGKLAAWFRELSGLRPLERTVLGSRGVHEKCPCAARFRLEQIARAAGCRAGEWPDFVADGPTHQHWKVRSFPFMRMVWFIRVVRRLRVLPVLRGVRSTTG